MADMGFGTRKSANWLEAAIEVRDGVNGRFETAFVEITSSVPSIPSPTMRRGREWVLVVDRIPLREVEAHYKVLRPSR